MDEQKSYERKNSKFFVHKAAPTYVSDFPETAALSSFDQLGGIKIKGLRLRFSLFFKLIYILITKTTGVKQGVFTYYFFGVNIETFNKLI